MKAGWLVEQLPRVMQEDLLLRALATAFEQVADTVQERVDALPAQLDVSITPEEQLRYLARWLGLALDPRGEVTAQRDLVRAVGRTLGSRGTRTALEDLLGAATGSMVEVADGGGVFGQNERVPVRDDRIAIIVDDPGPLTREQLLAFCADEVPVGAVVDLQVLGEGS